MNSDFLASLDKLIADEPARMAERKAENQRQFEKGQQDQKHVAELQPKIEDKLREVSAVWDDCLKAVNAKSHDLGFTGSVSGKREGEWYELQANFTLNAGSIGFPLKMTVTQRGEAQFDELQPKSFNFLEAEPSMFRSKLLDHVIRLYQKLNDER